MRKVVLMSIDGMRPDGFLKCGHPLVEELTTRSSYSLTAKNVFPSMTPPRHTSMFYSVPPQLHGTATNAHTPPVRAVNGLFEKIRAAGGTSALFAIGSLCGILPTPIP